MSFLLIFVKVLSYFCDNAVCSVTKCDTTAFYDITLKLLKTLGMLALPDLLFLNDSKFSLCSYGVLREKLKFLDF